MPDHSNPPTSPFGRGWIPAGRDLGLPGEGGSAPEAANLPALRHDGFSPDRQARFLQALSVGGSVRSAAAAVGISPQAVYLCRRRSAHFAAAWDAALVLAREHAEQVLAERALDGVEEAVFYHGEQVAVRRRFEGRLLLAHLARLDRKVESRPEAHRRSARFDELLAGLIGEGLIGEGSPQADAPRRSGQDPYLPPDRADHVARATDGLGPGAYPRARRRAEAEWDHWRLRAEQAVDRLSDPAPREYKSLRLPPVGPPVPAPAVPRPAPSRAPEFLAGTLSTSSTSPRAAPLRRARSAQFSGLHTAPIGDKSTPDPGAKARR